MAIVVGVTKGEVLYSASSLLVRSVSPEQLLAMKLSAWRDAIDRADAALLLAHMDGSFDKILESVKRFVPAHQVDKASYALEDLWEVFHGSQ